MHRQLSIHFPTRALVQTMCVTAFLAACSDTPTGPGPVDAAPTEVGRSDSGDDADTLAQDTTDTAETADAHDAADSGPTLPADLQDPWCSRFAGGPGSTNALIDWTRLSDVHATYRFFAPHGGYEAADLLLRDALGEADGVRALPEAAKQYAAKGVGACYQLSSDGSAEGVSEVTVSGGVATVRPGTGTIIVPADAAAIAIDLRGVAASDAVLSSLNDIARQVLTTPVSGTERELVEHNGLTDEVFNAINVYSRKMARNALPEIPGEAPEKRPVAVIVGQPLSPELATFAGRLRLAGVASLVGGDLHAGVAESVWVPLSQTEGMAVRVSSLFTADTLWPDVIEADLETLPDAGDWPTTLPAVAGSTQRPVHILTSAFGHGTGEPSTSRATALAGLVIYHGAARRFFPYFGTVGDSIDEALETLAAEALAAEQLSAKPVARMLARLAHNLHDGHGFVGTPPNGESIGRVPLVIDHMDGGLPVVIRSLVPELPPGTLIDAVDGTAMEAYYAERRMLVSASTIGHERYQIGQNVLFGAQAKEIEGTLPSGDYVSVTVEVVPPSQVSLSGDLGVRTESGWLDDYGASDLYLINLSSATYPDDAAVMDHVQTALASAAGIVLDLRGYPGPNVWLELAAALFGGKRTSIYRTPQWKGPQTLEVDEQQTTYGTIGAAVLPIALLVGPSTVSRAEDLGTSLVDADPNMVVVGRGSAATNGNITGVRLPGGFLATFTGMEVLAPDASVFHGVGIVPDIPVPPVVDDIANGIDSDVQAAVQALQL